MPDLSLRRERAAALSFNSANRIAAAWLKSASCRKTTRPNNVDERIAAHLGPLSDVLDGARLEAAALEGTCQWRTDRSQTKVPEQSRSEESELQRIRCSVQSLRLKAALRHDATKS